jgi:hypothetical protein
MTQAAPAAQPAEGARLLEPSISYALGAVLAVTPELLSRPTPCRGWDLRMLLRHASESLAAIGEGIEAGRVDLDPAAEDGDLAADPARAFRDRADQLLDAWTGPGYQRQVIEIADCPLAASVMAAAAGSPPSSGALPGHSAQRKATTDRPDPTAGPPPRTACYAPHLAIALWPPHPLRTADQVRRAHQRILGTTTGRLTGEGVGLPAWDLRLSCGAWVSRDGPRRR